MNEASSGGDADALLPTPLDRAQALHARLVLALVARRRFIYLALSLLGMTFCALFYGTSDVWDLGPGFITGTCVAAAAFCGATAVLVATSSGRHNGAVALLLSMSALSFGILFAAWFQLFVRSCYVEIRAISAPGLQERMLSGFLLLLVFSQDVLGSLGHVLARNALSVAEFAVLFSLYVGLLLLSVLYRIFATDSTQLHFELGITVGIVLLHLATGLSAPSVSVVRKSITAASSLLCLAALSAAMALPLWGLERVSEVIHRCVDVLLLLESHTSTMATIRS